MKYRLKNCGIGIGVQPFSWKFGYVTYGGPSHWFNLGPLTISWRW